MQENEPNNEITVQIKHTNTVTGDLFAATLCGTEAAFKKAASKPDITALNGPALFDALSKQDGIRPIETNYSSNIKEQTRRHGACMYHENGTRAQEQHRLDGKLHDSVNNDAALCRWDENGTLRFEAHYQSGHLQDGIYGEPAKRQWDENGILTHWQQAGRHAITDPAQLAKIQAREKAEDIFKPFGGNLKPVL